MDLEGSWVHQWTHCHSPVVALPHRVVLLRQGKLGQGSNPLATGITKVMAKKVPVICGGLYFQFESNGVTGM